MTAFFPVDHVLRPERVRTFEPAAEIHAVRAQAALVRSLLDELDRIAPPGDAARVTGELAAQTVEELAHLARRMMDAATAIAPQRVLDMYRMCRCNASLGE